MITWKTYIFLVEILAICSCGNNAPPPITVYSCSSSAIYRGTPIAPEQQGIPYVTVECGGCTAVLLTNEWALTATHCYWKDMALGIRAQLLTKFETVVPAGGLETLPKACGELRGTADDDLLLVKLQQPLMVNNSNTGYKLAIYDGDLSQIKSVNIYGYGDVCEPDNEESILRAGIELPVIEASPEHVIVTANSSGQYPLHMDSGGPFFVEKRTDSGTTRQLVGILARLNRGVPGVVDSARAVGPGVIKSLIQGRVPGF